MSIPPPSESPVSAERTVLVTGASSGIGEACVRHLDSLGFRVLAGFRDEAAGARLRAISPRVHPLRLDVADAGSIGDAGDAVADALDGGPLAGLVNNAGIAVAAPLEFVPIDALRRQLEVNVVGQVAVTQAMLPLLRRGRGRVVFMGSISGRFASPFLGPYAASKFALEAIADALRLELRPWGMHVAIVEPGVIATPIWRKSLASALELADRMSPRAAELYGAALRGVEERVRTIGGIPPERVARVVAHALTARRPRARYLVGADARVGVALNALPTRLRDSLVARRMPGARGDG